MNPSVPATALSVIFATVVLDAVAHAGQADLHVLRTPGQVRRFPAAASTATS